MKKALLVLLLLSTCLHIRCQCPEENKAFKAGESLSYNLYFNWKFIWVTVGSACLTVRDTTVDERPGYYCHLITRGSELADKLFVLRDTLECFIDTCLVPYYYRKGALEGDRYTVDHAWYSYHDGKSHVRQRFKTHRNEIRTNEQDFNICVYDMLSMMFRARSFDASGFEEGQKILFPMADRGKVEQQTLIYRGKKKFKTEGSKIKYRCLVFSFVEYEDGKEEEVVTFYITDDANHLPVRLDMYLRFGSAKAFLIDAEGVRNPQTSIIKK